ncbi:unnamed protein product [Mesocestoides corti]|uniref:Uncharacterized protein n=1 Tax=Mesocestoides corti TaxID=53468 RepID=A0A0R3U7B1_MESCO|nr:unnamed protein product [Mesocestoides corti]
MWQDIRGYGLVGSGHISRQGQPTALVRPTAAEWNALELQIVSPPAVVINSFHDTVKQQVLLDVVAEKTTYNSQHTASQQNRHFKVGISVDYYRMNSTTESNTGHHNCVEATPVACAFPFSLLHSTTAVRRPPTILEVRPEEMTGWFSENRALEVLTRIEGTLIERHFAEGRN